MQAGLLARLRHGFIALPLTFAGLPIYLHAPDFYAVQFGLSITTIGILLLLLRIVDAVQDPLIGALSDRYYQHRSALVVIGALLLAAGFWLLFHPPPEARPGVYLSWLAGAVLICTTGFSIISINVQAAGSLWPVNTQTRTSIAASREAIGLVGLLMASILPTVLAQYYSRAAALHYLALILLPILALGVWLFCHWLRSTVLLAPRQDDAVGFFQLGSDRWINGFLLIFTLSTFAASIPGILVLFYVRDYLQLEPYGGLFLLLYFLSGVLAMPLWQRISVLLGKPVTWLISMLLACSVFSVAFFLPPKALIVFCLVCVGSGMALGADLALPQAILADKVSSQPQAASRYCALMAFLSKASLALATGIVLPLVGWFGFVPGSSEHTAILPYAYALIPCCLKALCAALLFYYSRRYYRLPTANLTHSAALVNALARD